jgi:cell division protein FtsB
MPAPKKHFLRRILELRLFLVINLFILFFLSLSFGREFLRDYQIQREIKGLRAEAESLEARNLEIASYNADLQTVEFLEEEARLRLGLAEPGEQLVVIVDDQVAGSSDGQEELVSDKLITHNSQLETTDVSNPTRWYYYFFDQDKFVTLKAYGQ